MRGMLMVILLAALAAGARAETLPAMEKMRGLHGLWKGKVIGGPGPKQWPVWIEYETVSEGHAVLERLGFFGEPEDPKYRKLAMVSMYHQESDQMMMTHYCSANTQPRMRTQSIPADASKLEFRFVDSTNILNARMMNIRRMTLKFLPDGTLRHEWQSHGDVPPAVFEVRRVR